MTKNSLDLKILDQLQKDNSQTYDDMSETIGLSPTSCLRRVRSLRSKNYILGDHCILNEEILGFNVSGIVSIVLSEDCIELAEKLDRICQHHPEIQQCYIVSSNIDIVLFVKFKTATEYKEFLYNLMDIFSEISVREYVSSLVLSTVTNNRLVNLNPVK